MQRIYRGYPQMVHTMEVMEQMHREYEPAGVTGPADQMFQVAMNNRGQGFDPSYGQGYGWERGQGFDPRYGQGYGWESGQGFDPRYGQGYGWENGQGFDPRYGQGYGWESGQGLNQGLGQESVQEVRPEEGQDLVQEAQAETSVQNQAESALQPYMVYRRDEQEIPAIDRSQALRMEMDYFKSLYPQSVKKHQVLVEEVCDHLDYDGSSMYDEYPDRVSLLRTRDRVCQHAREAGIDDNRDLVQLLLINEMNRRRFLRKN